MTALTRADIVRELVSQNEGILTKNEATAFVDAFFEQISIALEKGEEVKLTGLGNFRVLNKKSRSGRNLKTGEAALISARRVVTFRPGPKLKKKMVLKRDVNY